MENRSTRAPAGTRVAASRQRSAISGQPSAVSPPRWWVVVVLFLLSLACGAATEMSDELAPTPSPATSPTPTTHVPNLVMGLEGDVRLRRLDWHEFQPTYLGAELRPGDLIRVPAGGQAVILCGERLGAGQDPLAVLQDVEGGLPCGAYRPGPRGELAPARVASAVIPYILFPRYTRLLNPRPTLRWHTLTDVTTYAVRIEGDQTTLGPVQVGDGALAFPADWPPLQAGLSYRVVVEAGEYSSKEETGNGFVVVAEAEAAEIRALQAELDRLPLSQAAVSLSVAHLYVARDLHGEAIELLEQVAGSGDPAVCDLLGDLYLSVGLAREAESWYQCALDGFGVREITEGQAEALAGLGMVYHDLGNAELARSHWEQARAAYEVLGDRTEMSRVAGWLDSTGP